MPALPPPVVWEFDAIGTSWRVHAERALERAAQETVLAEIAAFDRAWSRFRTDSVVTALARTGGVVPAPIDAALMLDALAEVTAATAGAVSPLVGASLEALGYGADASRRTGVPLPADADWQERVSWTSDSLSVVEPVLLDVGSLGKGRLVDRVLATLRECVHGTLVVDASGDLAVRGGPVRVALEHPYDPARAIGVATVADGAVCGSATNRRVWGDGLHHVLDARTGVPVDTVAATWAFSPDAMRADAVATALFFPGGADLAERWGTPWVRMFTDGRAQHSGTAPVALFT